MSQIAAYTDNSITTESRGRLVVMLYEGAIRFLNLAVAALAENDMPTKGTNVAKAMEIINELDCVLDIDAGGEVAKNLRSLYDFMRKHLQTAHLTNDAEKMKEVASLLGELNEGWKAIAN